MSRAKLKQAGSTVEYWYLQPKFKTKEDAEAAKELLSGLSENELIVFPHLRRIQSLTISGKIVLELFKVPNRTVYLEDVEAHLQERHFAARSAQSILSELCKENILYRLGPGTYAKRHDPASTVCADNDMATPVDGEPPGLELGKEDCCGCRDKGHTSS